jgi:NAD(P)-dependent dehydrogenase (short-subunit alcohol dehydrogenase family)
MSGELAGKVAVITGGSGGIGAVITARLAAEGCDCLIAARTEENLEATASRIAADTGRRIETCAVDLRSLEGCQTLAQAVDATFGKVDILVNCAGATKAGAFLDLDDEVWRDGFELKFWSSVRLSRLLWPKLKDGQGSVVNIVGGFARTPAADFMIAGAVNAALANFSKALAGLGLRDDVNVNTVHPGQTVTPRLDEIFVGRAAQAGITPEEFKQRQVDRQGIRRLGQPEDVANLVAFLCSPAARHIHGVSVSVDGGATSGLF